MRYSAAQLFFAISIVSVSCLGATHQQEMIFKEFEAITTRKIEDQKDLIDIFAKSPAEIRLRAKYIKKLVNTGLEKVYQISAHDRTFDNTVRAFDDLVFHFQKTFDMIHLLQMVNPDKQVRGIAQDITVDLGQFEVDAFQDRKFFQAISSYCNHRGKSDQLKSHEQYLLDEILKSLRLCGADLPVGKHDEIKNLTKKSFDALIQFNSNLSKDDHSITVTEDELDGLKQDVISNFKKSGEKYILGVDYPTYNEVMTYCSVSATREKLYLAFNNRAYPENMATLDELIRLRNSLAQKLGFESFAALNIEPEMAKSPQTVERFLTDLIKYSHDKAKRELELFLDDMPSGVELSSQGKIKPWDYSYILGSYKKKHFNLDERVVAEYFPIEKTIQGLMAIYENFLGLTFKKVEPLWKWHKDVELIEVYDSTSKHLCGYVYLDLYPRENKFRHICHATVVRGQRRSNDGGSPSVSVIIANFPKATRNKPALLKHSDVKTFFHEFGHAMHTVIARTEFASHSGTNVKCDFVEMPSQMFEEWMWDKDMLAKVSGHYKTGKPLPKEIIDKKIALKQLNSGFNLQRQCWFALTSLYLHQKRNQKDTNAILREVHDKCLDQFMFDERTHRQVSFWHLGWYAARYYGYLWSRVFAQDVFSEIKKRGLDKAATGKEFVDKILAKGGSQNPSELLEDYLGRKPSIDAFLKDQGFV